MTDKPGVIFLCTGNCCRSQMAEGLMRSMGRDRFEIHSAGSRPAGYVHPLAIEAMAEIGIDISGQASKGLAEFSGRSFDYVITVCDHAAVSCPNLRGTRATLHWPLPDPVAVEGTHEERLATARRVREELGERISEFLRQQRCGEGGR